MRKLRIVAGTALFVASVFATPALCALLGISEVLAYSTVGSVAAMAAGMLLYSGAFDTGGLL